MDFHKSIAEQGRTVGNFRKELVMRRTRVVPGKYGMSDIMLELKDAEVKAKSIPVHII